VREEAHHQLVVLRRAGRRESGGRGAQTRESVR
jgi:hypothetical protein